MQKRPQAATAPAAPSPLGAALRAARSERGLTLEQLAAVADLSAAFLSRLERGQTSTSISNLIRLSAVLKTPLDRLIPPVAAAPAPGGYVLRRGHDVGELAANAYRYKPLAGGLPHQAISAFELVYPPGAGAELGDYAHEGEEVLYLLEGTIDFAVAGRRVRLQPGDCLQFDARQPHRARNPGRGVARLLMIVTGHRPGQAATPSLAASRPLQPRQERTAGHEHAKTRSKPARPRARRASRR
jgi:transcriptional regulator with XRE-family HTH domain